MSGWSYVCPCGWTAGEPGDRLSAVEERVKAHHQWHRDDLRALMGAR